MKKGIFFVLLVGFSVFAFSNTVSAFSSSGRFFGGRIIDTKAKEIRELESAGYDCPTYGGASINITPIGSPAGTPTDFFIAPYSHSISGTTPTRGQLILGIYSFDTLITCTKPTGEKKDGKPVIDHKTVTLRTITLFSTTLFAVFGY